MKLGDHEVHVWLAFDGEFADATLLGNLALVLEPHERELAARRIDTLAGQYVLTRALQRSILSLYAPEVEPGQWRFSAGAGGKPELAPQFASHQLHFNISHTARLVVMAVGRRPSLGVDAECLAVKRTPLEITDRFFTATELAELAELPALEHTRRFYALWVLKEAWIKATGAGLASDLYAVSFEFEDASRACAFQMTQDDAREWCFWQGVPSEAHTLALALRGNADICVFRCGPGAPFTWQSQAPLRRVGSGQEQRPHS